MASSEIDLGRLDLVSTTSNMQVQVTSSAQFAPPPQGAGEGTSRLTTGQSGFDSACRPWVLAAHCYCFELHLKIPDEMAASRQEIVDGVAAIISTAAFWDQLLLEPHAVQIIQGHGFDYEDMIAVSLRHNGSGERSRPPIHQLCTDVPFHDVRPPPGVECETLESVRLALKFSYVDGQKRRKIHHQSSSMSGGLNRRFIQEISTPGEMDKLFEVGNECDVHIGPECDRHTPDANLDDWLLQDSNNDSMLEDIYIDEEMLESSSSKTVSCKRLPSLRKRSSSPSIVLPQQDHRLILGDVIELVDAAIRSAISTPPQRLSQGIKITRQESFERFSDLAPSLWSPGYLPAVSRRAAFLPTIGHALTNVGGKYCRSTGLCSRVNELARQNLISGQTSHGDSRQGNNMSTSLWRLLQKGCRESRSAVQPVALPKNKGLPVRYGDGGRVDSLGSSQELLSEMEMEPGDDDEGENCHVIEFDDLDEEDLFDVFYLGDLPSSSVEPAVVPCPGSSDCLVFEEEQLKHLIEDLPLENNSCRLEEYHVGLPLEDDLLSMCSSVDSVLLSMGGSL